MRKMILSIAGIMAAAMLFTQSAFAGEETAVPAGRGSVTVSAQGIVTVTPDKADISFGITSEAETASAAQAQNAQSVEAVREALLASGVDEKDIKTTGYYLYPQYRYNPDDDTSSITGYQLNTQLQVKSQDIPAVGGILTACIKAGANNVEGIQYRYSAYEEAYHEALTLAVENARKKALTLAAASNTSLGSVTDIAEGYEDSSYRVKGTGASFSSMDQEALYDDADAGMFTMLAGESEIKAQVTVTFSLLTENDG